MSDPRDVSQATDDELRAADAAAQVRTHRDHAASDESVGHPEASGAHAAGGSTSDPRDLDRPTADELRAADVAAGARADRSAERGHGAPGNPPPSQPK